MKDQIIELIKTYQDKADRLSVVLDRMPHGDKTMNQQINDYYEFIRHLNRLLLI